MKCILYKAILFTSVLTAAAACSGGDGGGGMPGEATVFAVATDFQTAGITSTVAVPELEVTQNAIDGVASTDPALRRFGDRIYVVNRFGADNVTIVDARAGTVVGQISTGSGSNPQDVAVQGDTIYVAALAAGGVLVLDASRPGEGVVAEIDLSQLDSEDGIPNCGTLHLVGDELFVACGILDDDDQFLTPRGVGKVAVIDTSDNSVTTTFDLQHERPFGFFRRSPEGGALGGDLLLATAPSFADLTQGCLQQIGIGGESEGCLVENSDLGGYANGLRYGPEGTLYISVTTGFDQDDQGPLGELLPYADGSLGASMTPAEHRPFDVAVCPTGHVAVSDAAGGLRVYDEEGGELTTEPLDLGMPLVQNGITCY